MIILNANLLFIHKWIFVIQPSSNAESGLSVFPLPSTLPSPFKKGKSSNLVGVHAVCNWLKSKRYKRMEELVRAWRHEPGA
ncbi:hypothetical protein KM043_009674 [Ampulex compressa]|nr:hypothetical protein KM043_009674 [Ampulex compressa]